MPYAVAVSVEIGVVVRMEIATSPPYGLEATPTKLPKESYSETWVMLRLQE